MRQLRVERRAVRRARTGKVRDARRSVQAERRGIALEIREVMAETRREIVQAMQAETAAIRPEIAPVTRARTVQEMAETDPAMQAETDPATQAETGPEMSAEIAAAETRLADAQVRVCARRQVGPCRFEAAVRRAFGPMGRFARSTVTAYRFGQTFTADARS
jgi:hypothetical protein